MPICNEPIITGAGTRCIVDGPHDTHFDGESYWAVEQLPAPEAGPDPALSLEELQDQVTDLREQIEEISQRMAGLE